MAVHSPAMTKKGFTVLSTKFFMDTSLMNDLLVAII